MRLLAATVALLLGLLAATAAILALPVSPVARAGLAVGIGGAVAAVTLTVFRGGDDE